MSSAAAMSELEPLTDNAESLQPTQKKAAQVQEITVHLFINGKGPKHVFTTQLLGWDADHLNVAAIRKQYRLKSLHARSSMGERGLELRANARNGLSFTSYRGGEGASVQLDGVAQSSFIQQSFYSLGALILVGAISLAFVTHNDSVSTTLSKWNKEPPVPLVIFGMLLFVFLFWRKLMDAYK